MRDVAFSCDDNGARFLCVTVWSLLHHYHGSEPIRINVFEGFGGHSEASKRQLAKVVGEFPNASVRYVNVEAAIAPYADLIMNRERSRWNVFTWTPIFTPMLLGDATGNVAHFDIDMLFNDDVSKLLDLDLGDNLIAAVAEYGMGDPIITEAVWGKGILPSEAERYFNTGTIVFNTEKCRAERTWEKILEWYRAHYDIADRIEQDAWNALYWQRTLLLPLKWNFHDRLVKSFAKWKLADKYWQGNPPRDCLEAAVSPSILHFWGPKKPWKTCHRPYRKLYHAAMRAVGQTPPREPLLAPWYDFINWWHLEDIRPWTRVQSAGFAKLRQSRSRILWRWRRRQLLKRVEKVFTLPAEWLGMLFGVQVMSRLPHQAMFRICDFAAAVEYAFDRRGRRYALDNLRRVLKPVRDDGRAPDFDVAKLPYDPSPRERKLIRGSYRNMARTVGHMVWTCRNPVARVKEVGIMSGDCAAALHEHRPAVTISGHIGCWEVLSQLALLEGHRMMSVFKRIGSDGLTKMLVDSRRAIGQEIIPADGAFKHLMAGIREGKSLGLLVDQHVAPEEGGIWVRFCGRPLPVSAAPAFFAAKAKAPIIVAWSRPFSDGRYRCEIIDLISPESARDIWRTTQRCATDLERIIRRHPSRWVMNYNLYGHLPSRKDLATLAGKESAE